jgi:hypothetical protein
MYLLFPVAYPFAMLLGAALGAGEGNTHQKAKSKVHCCVWISADSHRFAYSPSSKSTDLCVASLAFERGTHNAAFFSHDPLTIRLCMFETMHTRADCRRLE